MNTKQRKTSMRQVVDEHSPTYKRAVAAIAAKAQNPLTPREGEPVKFFRGARIRDKLPGSV